MHEVHVTIEEELGWGSRIHVHVLNRNFKWSIGVRLNL